MRGLCPSGTARAAASRRCSDQFTHSKAYGPVAPVGPVGPVAPVAPAQYTSAVTVELPPLLNTHVHVVDELRYEDENRSLLAFVVRQPPLIAMPVLQVAIWVNTPPAPVICPADT
jgi:hypothetical protein